MLNGHRHFPAALPLGEKSGIHEIWGSVGPGDGSNIFGTEKSTGPIGIRLPDRRAHSPFATPTAVITAVCAKENKILKHISPSPHFTCVCAVCLLPSLLYLATHLLGVQISQKGKFYAVWHTPSFRLVCSSRRFDVYKCLHFQSQAVQEEQIYFLDCFDREEIELRIRRNHRICTPIDTYLELQQHGC